MKTIILLYHSLKRISPELFFGGVLLMAVSIPLSRFGMSVAQFTLVGSWLLHGAFRDKWKRLSASTPALVLIAFFVIHIAGLIHSADLNYGLRDIRTKLPLLLLPVIFVSMPDALSRKQTLIVWYLFLGAVLGGSIVSASILFFTAQNDFRNIFPFISHIRFGLNVCLAVFVAGYLFFFSEPLHPRLKYLPLFLMAWFAVFLVITGLLTGIIILAILLLVFTAWKAAAGKSLFGRLSMGLVILITITGLAMITSDAITSYRRPDPGNLKNPEQYTSRGNTYTHDITGQPVENGSYIGMYVCESELRESWNNRSALDYDGFDERGQLLNFTLIRYLNSKNLRKDANGIEALEQQDISAIESGIANIEYTRKFSLKGRLYQLLWEYDCYIRGGNPGGHTVMQRLEFWKTAAGIIKENLLLGVGTGDVQTAFDKQYEKMNSRLDEQYRWRAHNQYLAVFVALGVFGFLWFIVSLFYPLFGMKKANSFLYLIFLGITMLSMLTEDTLETQAGATFFAFFNAWLLFGKHATLRIKQN